MSKFMDDDGIYPDLETLIAEIPDDVTNSKLYISAEVEFLDVVEVMDDVQSSELEQIVRSILQRVALLLNVDDEHFAEWIDKSPVMELIDDSPESIFAVSALLFGDLDLRQEILETTEPEDVLKILRLELKKFSSEEE